MEDKSVVCLLLAWLGAWSQGTGPVLAGTVNFGSNGGAPGLRLGDLNGDGRLDLVMGQPMPQPDAHTPQQVVRVTAYSLMGEVMWQYAPPAISDFSAHGASSDIPLQVYDWDGDGAAEVIAAFSSNALTFLNGRDGRVMRTLPIPMGTSATGPSGSHDCILIANLRGTPYPRDFILKTRYTQSWGINGETGEILWTHRKSPALDNMAHYGYAFDADGDGRDEYLGGFELLSHAGKVLWTAKDLTMHLDAVAVGDADGDLSNGPEIAMASQVATLYGAKGKEIWRDNHTTPGGQGIQQIAMGNFDAASPGKEVVMLERIGPRTNQGRDGNILVAADGKLLWKEVRTGTDYGWLSVTERITNWDGKGSDQILTYRRTTKPPTIYDGKGLPVAEFRHPGSYTDFLVHADLCGDGREEVIVYNETTAWIFANGGCDLAVAPGRKVLPQIRRLYNWSIYSGWDATDYSFYVPGTNPISILKRRGVTGTPRAGYYDAVGKLLSIPALSQVAIPPQP